MLKNNEPHNRPLFIIVGQGLAGSLLAWSLMQQDNHVHIYSDGKPSASRVAAGMINPVTGQRFVLAEQTPEMLRYATIFYQRIEKKLHIQCFFPTPMIRLFNTKKEQENCRKRLKNDLYRKYLQETDTPKQLLASFSGIQQTSTAWLDTNVLLDALHNYFKSKHAITQRAFKSTKKQMPSTKIIYCEGYKMMDNPLFSWLPLQPAHGQIITCSSTQPLPPYIINQKQWLLPTSKYTCRIGATYDTNIYQPQPKASAEHDLHQFATNLFHEDRCFALTHHQAGIRPTTKDKQPFIGFHPQHQNTAIFNGFGSRGSLLIPWYSKLFTAHLQNQGDIPPLANIQRLYSLFFTS